MHRIPSINRIRELKEEIAALVKLNAIYKAESRRSEITLKANVYRGIRLLEIREELGAMESFLRVRSDRMENPKVQFSARLIERSLGNLPELNLKHLNQMTDDTGMLQHAIFTIPNRREGYTTDDNARALILAVLLEQLDKDLVGKAELPVAKPAGLYLSFLENAFNPETERFKNFLGYDRRWHVARCDASTGPCGIDAQCSPRAPARCSWSAAGITETNNLSS